MERNIKIRYNVGGVLRYLYGELVREDANFIVIRGAMGDLFTVSKAAIFERIDYQSENGGGRT
jgi:hypothetical protein